MPENLHEALRIPSETKVTIRDTLESELAALLRIRMDPLVAAQQYPLTARDLPEVWRELLFGDHSNARAITKCSTVLLDGNVIGHISQLHWRVDDQAVCQLGWNLLPAYWGRGIMTSALTELFDSFFSEPRVNFVIADCFWNNRRCIRLMERLHFHPIPIELWDRVRTAFAAQCWRWIRRFELSAATWKEHRASQAVSIWA
jgi:RimJ/RimL family protein N-acetyltransferase